MKQTGERGAHAPRSLLISIIIHSVIAVLFCMTKQIEERKGRDTDQIFSAFRIVDAKIIGGFGYHDGSRGLSAQLYDRGIIRDRGALPVFHFDEDVPGIGVFHHDIDFFPPLARRDNILPTQPADNKMRPHACKPPVSTYLPHLDRITQHRVVH